MTGILYSRAAHTAWVGVWLGMAATVLIWQLTFIALAAITFHVGEGLLLVLAWRDREAFAAARVAPTVAHRAARASRKADRGASGLDHAAAITAVGSARG